MCTCDFIRFKHIARYFDFKQNAFILEWLIISVNVDGTKLKEDGFTLEVPKLETKTLKEILTAYADMKVGTTLLIFFVNS